MIKDLLIFLMVLKTCVSYPQTNRYHSYPAHHAFYSIENSKWLYTENKRWLMTYTPPAEMPVISLTWYQGPNPFIYHLNVKGKTARKFNRTIGINIQARWQNLDHDSLKTHQLHGKRKKRI